MSKKNEAVDYPLSLVVTDKRRRGKRWLMPERRTERKGRREKTGEGQDDLPVQADDL